MNNVSFQAYLDNIEDKTSKTPNEFIELASKKSFNKDTKPMGIVNWLKEDFDLGRGREMALVHVIKNGPPISNNHVDTDTSNSDESDTLKLDGLQNR